MQSNIPATLATVQFLVCENLQHIEFLIVSSVFLPVVDATHSQGKKVCSTLTCPPSAFSNVCVSFVKNALMFEVGGNAVIPGINEGKVLVLFLQSLIGESSPLVVKELGVGEKVQAIIPPTLAFGDKGICIESGECLVKPGATLVYDIYLKRSAIPPP